MYPVVEELLAEAQKVNETPLITAEFFPGFVAVFLLELLACPATASGRWMSDGYERKTIDFDLHLHTVTDPSSASQRGDEIQRLRLTPFCS